MLNGEARTASLHALAADSIVGKLAAMDVLSNAILALGSVSIGVSPAPTGQIVRGCPIRPPRVQPLDLPPRSNLSNIAGRAALIHAVAHIEYSAIDLALDHALRFHGLPARYYFDWIGVALDETRHFRMLSDHLTTLGYDYGDFPVHDSLWEMAERTTGDCLTRMALVPRLLEARGLDATPPIQKKLTASGDKRAVEILKTILADEQDHVAIGDRWYRYLCEQQGLEPETTFRELIRKHNAPWPQRPLNIAARLAAGFAQEELDCLTLGPMLS
jgi:uncharacterized ferritin-like protein (DUF455 family)